MPAGTIVVGVADGPDRDAVLTTAAERARSRRCDVTLVHALAVEERFGADPAVLEEVLTALVEAGQELLAAAREEVRRVAPTVRVREVLRLVDVETALDEVRNAAAEVLLGSDVPRRPVPGHRRTAPHPGSLGA